MEDDGYLTFDTNLITSSTIVEFTNQVSSVTIEKDKVFVNGIETVDAQKIGKEILKCAAAYRDEQQFINRIDEL